MPLGAAIPLDDETQFRTRMGRDSLVFVGLPLSLRGSPCSESTWRPLPTASVLAHSPWNRRRGPIDCSLGQRSIRGCPLLAGSHSARRCLVSQRHGDIQRSILYPRSAGRWLIPAGGLQPRGRASLCAGNLFGQAAEVTNREQFEASVAHSGMPGRNRPYSFCSGRGDRDARA